MSQATQREQESEIQFDETWSRLIYTIGKDALKRLQSSKVLLIGLKGLGVEIAKNIVLMGVASLTLQDVENVEIRDLSSQFFLSESSINKNRAEESLVKLKELNERVDLKVNNSPLTEEFLKEFTVVCVTNATSKTELLRINSLCRKNNIAFIAADTLGLFGYVFNDFGDSFTVIDKNGENPKTAYVESITKDKESLLTVVDSHRHDLEDGDIIKITEVEGMTELNGNTYPVTVKGPFVVSIGNTENFSEYIKGGFIEEVKQPKTVYFNPLSSFFPGVPDFDKVALTDYSKFDKINTYHAFLQSYLDNKEKGNVPRPWNKEDASKLLGLAKSYGIEDINENTLLKLALTSAGDLSPMAVFLGGVVAQEIIKVTSSKYLPINQWLYFDALECLPAEDLTEDEVKPLNSRYDGQIAVFGKEFNERLLNARYFLVGSGAIGCEMLKNWAMIGLGCGKNGHIDVTDMDTIEISNLNRQFLYRPWQVGKLKSETAAEAVKEMNKDMNIKAWSVKVCQETEDVYDFDFWSNLTGVCNALDNVQARLYVDKQCVFYRKSLLESGTLGTKGNTQVIVPFLTESYGSTRDPPAKETPVCLLHSFPNNIEHCLQWAREQAFEGNFVKDPETVNNYLTKSDYLKSLPQTMFVPTLEILENNITNRQKTFDECIIWARNEFDRRYDHQPRQILFNFPLDHIDSNGTPFWSGAKRPPKPIQFDAEDPLHLDYIVSATFLRAYTLSIINSEFKPSDYTEKIAYIKEKAAKIESIPFKVQTNLKINTDVESTVAIESNDDEDDGKSKSIIEKLPSPSSLSWRTHPLDFEKDDEKNFHIDFVTAAANLRAVSYGIPTVDRLKAKLIAGKIIPAIVTTTASVTGLVCLELYKLFQKDKKIEDYRNTFINLALSLFQQSEPVPPSSRVFLNKKFTLWDRIEIKKDDITLQQLCDYMKEKENFEVAMVSVGASLIYASFMASGTERLPRKLTELIEEISKESLKGKRFVVLEMIGYDEEGEDVEDMPTTTLFL